MRFQQVKEFILDELGTNLPKNLAYHTIGHVMDVYDAAENLGSLEGINPHEMKLLLTSALFHDAGFMNDANAHEEESCRIASEYLPEYGYSSYDIKAINGMIMATKIPQSPNNRLEEIICDADLDYLGRDDFFSISDALFEEFITTGVVKNKNEWNKVQAAFFEKHRYFTQSALKLRQQKKEEHLAAIRANIK